MKSDIEFPAVEGVTMAIARKPIDEVLGTFEWFVYLINNNKYQLRNVLITSKGYGVDTNEGVKTATLRQHFDTILAESATVMEMIQPETFALVNEFWISFYIDGVDKILDRKFVFMPETVSEANLRPLELINLEGVLHS